MTYTKNLALTILMIGIGILFVFHGFPKIMGGFQTWMWLGNSVSFNHFYSSFFGFLATSIEFLGGILLVLGLKTRIASLLLLLAMAFAIIFHLRKDHSFKEYSQALKDLFIFVSLFVSGTTSYSLDSKLKNKK